MKKFLSYFKGRKLFLKLAIFTFICSVFLSLAIVPSSAATVSDLTGTTWLFDETFSRSSVSVPAETYKIDFISNNRSFKELQFGFNNMVDGSYLPQLNYFYSVNGVFTTLKVYTDPLQPYKEFDYWLSDSYRLITISSGADVKNTDLINILDQYAVQVSVFTILNDTFFFTNGLTWSEFVSSDFNDGRFAIVGDSVTIDGVRINGVTPSDLIVPDRVYTLPATASYLLTLRGVMDWFSNTLSDVTSIFYVEGSGLTLLGVLAVVSVSIAIIFLLIGVLSRFLVLRG